MFLILTTSGSTVPEIIRDGNTLYVVLMSRNIGHSI